MRLPMPSSITIGMPFPDAEFVKLSYQRYISDRRRGYGAENYESRIIVIGPECAEIQLFQAN